MNGLILDKACLSKGLTLGDVLFSDCLAGLGVCGGLGEGVVLGWGLLGEGVLTGVCKHQQGNKSEKNWFRFIACKRP